MVGVAVKVTAVPLHVGFDPDVMAMLTDGAAAVLTVTPLITCADGPLQPLAVTCILTEPENPFAHVITPVDALIEPAAGLLRDQLKPELLVAVVE